MSSRIVPIAALSLALLLAASLPSAKVGALMPGDANCDGAVNPVDATFILQFSAGLIAAVPCPQNADVSHDGRIDPLDSALILQLSAGLIDSLAPPPPTQPPAPVVAEAVLIAADGEFLGVFTCNQFAVDGIFNRFGSYGSQFSGTSIWNRFGTYGGLFGTYSPFNIFATPPSLTDGSLTIYLTVSGLYSPSVTPLDLVLLCFENNNSKLDYWLGQIEDNLGI